MPNRRLLSLCLASALLVSAGQIRGENPATGVETAMIQSGGEALSAEALSKLRAWANQRKKAVTGGINLEPVELGADIAQLFAIGNEPINAWQLEYRTPDRGGRYFLAFPESGFDIFFFVKLRDQPEGYIYLTDSTRKLRASVAVRPRTDPAEVRHLTIAQGTEGYQNALRVWAGVAARPRDQFH